ncbi:hypothetical protein [Xylophilus sp. GOD-11R]|uniref:hypothetical protein n=1 Tax=Xylophilus sp. GOD-11R TaxID=3089814 RepID=UPI00298CF88B|nr:hypothetical protein [Xylophilus sp. GOD-11R]WPB59296.1 hypothetical protein R9X41_11890 [Xylophilus sp. GOD-11R]
MSNPHVAHAHCKNVLVSIMFLGAAAAMAAASQDCVGDIEEPPIGMVAASDESLLTEAIGLPGNGALCKGRVFVVDKPVRVFRVWDGSKPHTQHGRWWSFFPPLGPREKYARDNDICPEWSPLDTVSSCMLKPGARVVMGPGQGAQCADRVLPPSSVNQVYIPNDGRQQILFVDHCGDGSPWPE